MAENMAESSGLGAGTEAAIQPSIWNALPYFISLTIFPLAAGGIDALDGMRTPPQQKATETPTRLLRPEPAHAVGY